MDPNGFRVRDWPSGVDNLTALQRKGVLAALSTPPEGKASLAAIELEVDERRRCPLATATGHYPVASPCFASLPLQRVRENKPSTPCAHQVVRPVPQGVLACLWRFPYRRGDHQGVG